MTTNASSQTKPKFDKTNYCFEYKTQQVLEMTEGFDLLFQKHKIDEVSIEDMFYAFNPKTVIKLAQFRGAISLKILQEFGNFAEYTPLQVKQAVTGNGKATKEQVAFMVKRLLNVKKEIKPLDITDAIATNPVGFSILCCTFSGRICAARIAAIFSR